MNPTLRKYMALADTAKTGSGTHAAYMRFMRLVKAEDDNITFGDVTKNLPAVRSVSVGQLITFNYTAKHANDLPYWDRQPLVLVTAINKDGWTGVNLHYIHPRIRARMLYDSTKNSIPIIEQEMSNLCVKRYLAKNVSRRPREFPKEYWDVAIQLPFEEFSKAAKQSVWNKTSRKRKK